jgi:hypothetical protein
MCIIIVAFAYGVGVHAGRNTTKMSCPGIIKMARDEEDKGYYFALEVKGKDALKEMYNSDTVTFEVRRMSDTQIKQGL